MTVSRDSLYQTGCQRCVSSPDGIVSCVQYLRCRNVSCRMPTVQKLIMDRFRSRGIYRNSLRCYSTQYLKMCSVQVPNQCFHMHRTFNSPKKRCIQYKTLYYIRRLIPTFALISLVYKPTNDYSAPQTPSPSIPSSRTPNPLLQCGTHPRLIATYGHPLADPYRHLFWNRAPIERADRKDHPERSSFSRISKRCSSF